MLQKLRKEKKGNDDRHPLSLNVAGGYAHVAGGGCVLLA